VTDPGSERCRRIHEWQQPRSSAERPMSTVGFSISLASKWKTPSQEGENACKETVEGGETSLHVVMIEVQALLERTGHHQAVPHNIPWKEGTWNNPQGVIVSERCQRGPTLRTSPGLGGTVVERADNDTRRQGNRRDIPTGGSCRSGKSCSRGSSGIRAEPRKWRQGGQCVCV
jgi:hypothetical protein